MHELQKSRPKLRDIPIQASDLDAILDLSIRSIKMGRTPKFTNDENGLEEFKQASIEYLEHIKSTNDNPANENKLIPDIESWATFLGTTRATICSYERTRNEDWRDFIALVKGSITAVKKQLAFRQKIPTVLAIFDLTNNSGYINSSEFKLSPGKENMDNGERALTVDQLPKLGQIQSENNFLEEPKTTEAKLLKPII